MRRATFTRDKKNMELYKKNKVIAVNDTPCLEEYFGSLSSNQPDYTMKQQRYTHLLIWEREYLLRPNFERVRNVGFCVEPLEFEKVDVAGSVFSPSVRDLLVQHRRKDGMMELREVELEGDMKPHTRYGNQEESEFVGEYLVRPLKRMSVRDVVLVVPSYERFVVMGRSEDDLGLSVVSEQREGEEGVWYLDRACPPVMVEFEKVRVVQEFRSSGGCSTNVLLLPDFRGIN